MEKKYIYIRITLLLLVYICRDFGMERVVVPYIDYDFVSSYDDNDDNGNSNDEVGMRDLTLLNGE